MTLPSSPSTTFWSVCTTAALATLTLAGCAATGAASPSARPVFYPNPTLNRVGPQQANREADVCTNEALNAGLTPEANDNAVGRGAAKGAAIGGVGGAVGALVRGRSPERVVERGVGGAVVGGAVGAVAGSFNEKPSSTYRHYIQRCLRDKGFEVIGWN